MAAMRPCSLKAAGTFVLLHLLVLLSAPSPLDAKGREKKRKAYGMELLLHYGNSWFLTPSVRVDGEVFRGESILPPLLFGVRGAMVVSKRSQYFIEPAFELKGHILEIDADGGQGERLNLERRRYLFKGGYRYSRRVGRRFFPFFEASIYWQNLYHYGVIGVESAGRSGHGGGVSMGGGVDCFFSPGFGLSLSLAYSGGWNKGNSFEIHGHAFETAPFHNILELRGGLLFPM